MIFYRTLLINILFLGASPIDEVRLRIDEELRDIENGLKLATLRDQFELKSKWAVTAKTLQQAMLDEHPTIVHFSGHGDTFGIAVEDTLGNSKLIENDAIGAYSGQSDPLSALQIDPPELSNFFGQG